MTYYDLACGIASLLYSINLILFTVLLVHLILHILSSDWPSLSSLLSSTCIIPSAFHFRLNQSVPQIFLFIVFWFPRGCFSRNWTRISFLL